MLFIQTLSQSPKTFFMVAFVVIFSICLHEFCHAWVALKLGDSTAADAGHLTLNPLKQMGFMSVIMFLFIGIAWGAVPVKRSNLRRRGKYAEILVALAGPALNFVLFLAAWLLTGFLAASGRLNGVMPNSIQVYFLLLLFLLGRYNFVLCIFNLLPVPGLDGWNVYAPLFPQMQSVKSEVMKGIMIFLIFALIFSSRYLFMAADYVMELSLQVFA